MAISRSGGNSTDHNMKASCSAGRAELSIAELGPRGKFSRVDPTFFEICHVMDGSVRPVADRMQQWSNTGDLICRTGNPLPPLEVGSSGATCLFIHLDRGWPGWALAGVVEPAPGTFIAGDFQS